MLATKTIGIQQWNRTLWSQQKNPKKNSVWWLCFVVSKRK
jgi:hypothetical protein